MWWHGYTAVKQASRDVWRIASLLSQSSVPTCLRVNGSITPGLGLGPRWPGLVEDAVGGLPVTQTHGAQWSSLLTC